MIVHKLQGKKMAVVGFGVNNQALAQYLKRENLDFTVIDSWQSPDDLIGRLDQYDLIFRTPGLPYLSTAIQQAKAKGVEISSQTKLFFELCPAPIIGVTGTKGKGTTSSLIAQILMEAKRTVWLGGNIGRDPFEFLEQIKPTDDVILELSSFQLQDLEMSPHIAVVLNITPDHLNHHLSISEYINAKSRLVVHQAPTDIAVLHPSLPDEFKRLGAGKKIFFDPAIAAKFKTNLLGRHNYDNVAAAVTVTIVLGVPENVIISALEKFQPLPHRLNPLGNFDGITYIDDGFSTNVDPVMAAIDAVPSPLILIVGGFDKGLDFTEVGRKIKATRNVKGVVVVGQMTKQILLALAGFSGRVLTGAKNMTEILTQARSLATIGDTILFSPGTSSFDMFKNETDRAEQFVTAATQS